MAAAALGRLARGATASWWYAGDCGLGIWWFRSVWWKCLIAFGPLNALVVLHTISFEPKYHSDPSPVRTIAPAICLGEKVSFFSRIELIGFMS